MIPRQTFIYALCWILVPSLLLAQNRFLRGRVVFVGPSDELTPAEGVEITFLEQGDTARTNAQGLFRLFLADQFDKGDKITVDVKKEGWRIQYPLDGEINIPAEFAKKVVQLLLLPVGSKKFWSADRIEKFIRDTAARAKEQVKLEGKSEEINFGRYIKAWATQYGFSAQEAKAEIDKWVAEVQKQQDDPYKLGLAAYAEKKFGEANTLFMESAQANVKQLEALRHQEGVLVEKTVRDFRLAGDAAYNNYRFDQALIAYESALGYVSRKTHPRLWADVSIEIGLSHADIGIRTNGPMVHEHLDAAQKAYRLALAVYTRDHLPQDWAGTQNNLGIALKDQGIRTGGEEGRTLLGQAVEAYRLALAVYTRDHLPQDWAMTQNNLGNALKEQGIRTGGEEGRTLLAQGVEAYRLALAVYTRDHLPQQWAGTQNNLGNALQEQGIRTGGEEGRTLLGQAVEAYRLALAVRTRDHLPQDWAMTQNNLGSALSQLGKHEHNAEMLREAEVAVKSAYAFYMDSGDTQYDEYFKKKLSEIRNLIKELE